MPLVDTLKPEVAVGLTRYNNEYEVATQLNRRVSIDWRLGDQLLLLDTFDSRFGAVVGAPPWNWNPDTLVVDSDSGPVRVRDYLGNLLILKASMLMESGGTGLFVVPQSFTGVARSHGVYANLNRFGLFVDAVLALPGGHFEPTTSLPGLLIVIRRREPEKLFVGELSLESRGTLLKNLKSRKEGKVPQLGTLVDPQAFTTFPILLATREIERLGRSLGFPVVSLSEIAIEVNLVNRRIEDGFADKPNSVYLPLIGRSSAVASLADTRMKPQNYAQLVLDPDRAMAPYVANFFDSALGQRIRESLLSGGAIPRINKSTLLDADVHLPSIQVQAEALRVQSVITDLSTQLETYQRQLWNQPRRLSEIERSLNTLNREDNFESWIESLPFPLASILWVYHADSDVRQRSDHLLHFFEALSEFTATVLLSAYAADKDFYARQSEQWVEEESEHQNWFLRATFGGWNTLGARLAKVTRRFLNNSDTRERIVELFGRPEIGFLEMLTSKKLFNILDAARVKRNKKAHGGIVSDQDAKRLLALLESDLSEVRQVVADWYTTALLLSPKNAEFREDIYYYRVKALMGSRTIFRQRSVTTLAPMDTRRLYLLHENQYQPVKLVPFLRLMPSPKTEENACYFYSRIEGEKVRWVSYHFPAESEVWRADAEVVETLSLLRRAADS